MLNRCCYFSKPFQNNISKYYFSSSSLISLSYNFPWLLPLNESEKKKIFNNENYYSTHNTNKIMKYLNSNNISEVYNIYQDLLKQNIYPQQDTLRFIIEKLSLINIKDTIDILNSTPTHLRIYENYNYIIKSYVLKGDITNAILYLGEIQNIFSKIKPSSFNIILDNLLFHNDTQMAESFIKKILSNDEVVIQIKSQLIYSIIKYYIKNNNYSKVISWLQFEIIKGYELTIKYMLENNQLENANNLLDYMKDNRIIISAEIYTYFMKKYYNLNDYNKVMKYYNTIISNTLTPTPTCINILCEVAVKNTKQNTNNIITIEEIMDIIDKYNIKVSLSFYNILMSYYAQQNNYNELTNIINIIKRKFPFDKQLFDNIINGLIQVNEYKYAYNWLIICENMKIKLNGDIYMNLLNNLSKNRDILSVLQMLLNASNHKIFFQSSNEIKSYLFDILQYKNNQKDYSKTVLSKILELYNSKSWVLDNELLCLIATYSYSYLNYDIGNQVIDFMLSQNNTPPSSDMLYKFLEDKLKKDKNYSLSVHKDFLNKLKIPIDTKIYKIFLKYACLHNNYKHASEYYQILSKNTTTPSKQTMNLLIQCAFKSHSFEDGNKLINYYKKVNNSYPFVETLSIIIQEYAKNGNIQNSLSWYNLMKDINYTIPSEITLLIQRFLKDNNKIQDNQ